MNRLERKFQELKKGGKKVLIPYLTAGYPNLSATKRLVVELEKAGADIMELGVPFSDPVADGITIQKTSAAALKKGVNLAQIFATVSQIRRESQLPLILMGYYNPILSYGVERFVNDCALCGVDGIIVADLPPEEAREIIPFTRKKKLGLIFLLAPNSTPERIRLISQKSHPFLYYVSVTGVTGARKGLPADLEKKIVEIRHFTHKPICLGFGISSPAQAKTAFSLVDGIIVGSALLDCLEKAGWNYLNAARKFVSSLAAVK